MGSARSKHQVVVELFVVGVAEISEAGVPPPGVVPTLNPLKHRGVEMSPVGPGLPVDKSCFTQAVTEYRGGIWAPLPE